MLSYCLTCNKAFYPLSDAALYCSIKCKNRAAYYRRRERDAEQAPEPSTATSNTRAIFRAPKSISAPPTDPQEAKWAKIHEEIQREKAAKGESDDIDTRTAAELDFFKHRHEEKKDD